MKKSLLFLVCLSLFVFSLKKYLEKNSQKTSLIKKTEVKKDKQKKEIKISQENKNFQKINEKHRSFIKKNRMVQLNKTADLKPGTVELKGEDDKSQAVSDPFGNIYPENVFIDEEYIVAYGDIIVGYAKNLEDYQNGDRPLIIAKPQLWPKGIVPYILNNKITKNQKQAFENIAKDLKEKTGIQLIKADLSKHRDYLKVSVGKLNCYANVGYRPGVSNMSLSPQCNEFAIYHEIFHVLGFFHEQNRFDRDDYLQIVWENIKDGYTDQFQRFAKESFPKALQETDFSFNSFMLYRPETFSATNDFTMVSISGDSYITPSAPTNVDYERIKTLYLPEL